MTRSPQPPRRPAPWGTHRPTSRGSHRSSPWGAANLVVLLSLVTSMAAHAGAGGLLPGLPGSALLLPLLGLLWLVAARTSGTSAGLVGSFSLGQLACHLGYQVGTLRPPTLLVDADGHRHWGDPLAGHATAPPAPGHPMTGHLMASAAGGPHPMAHGASAAMAHGSHAVGGMLLGMLLAHAAAVLVCTALVLSLRHLPAAARRWWRTLLPTPPAQLVVPATAGAVPSTRRWVPRWAHAPPPPRRGPPVLA